VKGQVVEVLLPVVAGEPTLYSVQFGDGHSEDFTRAELESLLVKAPPEEAPLEDTADGEENSGGSGSSGSGKSCSSGDNGGNDVARGRGGSSFTDDSERTVAGHGRAPPQPSSPRPRDAGSLVTGVGGSAQAKGEKSADDGGDFGGGEVSGGPVCGADERESDEEVDETESEELTLTLSGPPAAAPPPPRDNTKEGLDEDDGSGGEGGEGGDQDDEGAGEAALDTAHVAAPALPKDAAAMASLRDPVALFGKASFTTAAHGAGAARAGGSHRGSLHLLHLPLHLRSSGFGAGSGGASPNEAGPDNVLRQSSVHSEEASLFSFAPVWGL
jgi:hypothetical protein